MNVIQCIIRNKRGSVALLVAGFIVILLGSSALVIDLGSTYHETSRLQNAMDSAALAGVQELGSNQPTSTTSQSWTNAVAKAIQYAELNGYTVTENGVTVTPVQNTAGSKIMGVKVTGSKLVPYSMARIFGINDTTVTRSASAMLKVVDTTTGVIPFYIAKSYMDSVAGTTITISSKDLEGATGGRIGPVYMNSSESGYSTIGTNVIKGYPGTVTIGQKVFTKTGAFAANLKNDVKTRIDTLGSLALVPIVQRFYQGDTNENGIFESNENMTGDTNLNRILDPGETWVIASLRVVSFAAMEITYPQGQPDFTITAKFVTVVSAGGESRDLNPPDYGVYTIDLTD